MLEGMGQDEMRAADSDRQRVADSLKVALDEGRLDLHEYDERLQRAYGAKTYGDLKGLLDDLPVPALTPPVPAPRAGGATPAATAASNATARWLLALWSSWIPAVLITTTIWVISSVAAHDLLYFWPFWVAGPWGAFLVWQTVVGLTHGEPAKAQLEREQAERKKELKRERKALEAEAIARGEVPEAQKESDNQA